ncbi:MAG: FKBP-type peptidyl-prolyl cis-trans isomerase [Holophagales bacterium]|nr:FKBP-type peptidyl-prolyl cis-trans isomerase [Holophagales bacterium]MYC11175.1 FKBP-type peptidyl-prolyl cis-trans isomerase [Holophagales bacterium]
MRAMNKPRTPFLLTAAILVLVAAAPACAQEEAGADYGDERPIAETWDEKASYALGVNIGSNLDPEDLTLDADLLLRGFRDSLEGSEAMDSDEIDAVLSELGAKMQEHADRARQAAMMENTAKSAAFLAQKAREEGIVKTDSGLLYREVRTGEGDSPTANQSVTVHYRGTLIDGRRFDGTYERDQPATFPIGSVIPGWAEALQLMKPGAKWEVFIPAELAYGAHGSGPAIPPAAALVFEIELLEVQ